MTSKKTVEEIKPLVYDMTETIKDVVCDLANELDADIHDDVALGQVKYLCECLEENLFEKQSKFDLVESTLNMFFKIYDILDVLKDSARFKDYGILFWMNSLKMFCTKLFVRSELADKWIKHAEWWD